MARGLGALTSGFQEGYGFSAGARRERQLDKLYDLKMDEMKIDRSTRLAEMEKLGQDPADFGIDTGANFGGMTIGEKLAGKFKSWITRGSGGADGGGGNPAEAVSGSGALPAGSQSQEEEKKQGQPNFNAGGSGFADGGAIRGFGGPVRKAIAARKRTHTPDPVASYADGGRIPIDEVDPDKLSPEAREQLRRQQAQDRTPRRGDPDKYRPARTGQTGNAPRGRLNRLGRGVKAGAHKSALPLAAGASAINTLGTDTDEYRRRYEGLFGGAFEHEEDDWGVTGLGKDMAIRGIGAMEDFGNTLLEPLSWVGLREGHGRYDEEGAMAPKGVDPAAGAALEENLPPSPEETAQTPSEEDPPGTAPAREEMFEKQQLGGSDGDLLTPDDIIDWSSGVTTIPPDEIPRHTTKEWENNTKFHMAMAAARGEDPWAVHEKIVETQIRNFTNYAYQAQNLMVAGDMMGAARALTAGYQYFPNGSDVTFGIVQGKDGKQYLMGMGRDEESQEPVGNPYAITPQMLGTMMAQAQDPKAWTTWTKDWHELALKHQEFMLARDEAEGQLAVNRENAISNRMIAESRQYDALYDGAGSLPTYSQVTAAEKEIKNDLRYEGTELQLTPDQTTQVSGLIADIYAQTGIHYGRLTPIFIKGMEQGQSPEEIYQAIMQQASGQAIEAP